MANPIDQYQYGENEGEERKEGTSHGSEEYGQRTRQVASAAGAESCTRLTLAARAVRRGGERPGGPTESDGTIRPGAGALALGGAGRVGGTRSGGALARAGDPLAPQHPGRQLTRDGGLTHRAPAERALLPSHRRVLRRDPRRTLPFRLRPLAHRPRLGAGGARPPALRPRPDLLSGNQRQHVPEPRPSSHLHPGRDRAERTSTAPAPSSRRPGISSGAPWRERPTTRSTGRMSPGAPRWISMSGPWWRRTASGARRRCCRSPSASWCWPSARWWPPRCRSSSGCSRLRSHSPSSACSPT